MNCPCPAQAHAAIRTDEVQCIFQQSHLFHSCIPLEAMNPYTLHTQIAPRSSAIDMRLPSPAIEGIVITPAVL